MGLWVSANRRAHAGEGSFQGTSVTRVAKPDYQGTSETALGLPKNAYGGFVGSDPAACPWD